ncbi:copper chaperone PCu(A)C [Massilia sp. PWRC2]|uniref:copper chaperone PCu(A)C n=1 Tax=Massilia sp. PWRC2 TaxID=2804626 RepID=UPI003CF1EFFC
MKFLFRLSALSAALLASAVHAQVVITAPWVRATVPQQKATSAFMQLHSPTNSRLVGATSAVAAIVEIHEMAIDHDVMRMRQVSGVDLPAGKAVALQPGGYHVMLIDLKQQVKSGETVPLTLVFQDGAGKRSTVEVKAAVRALNAALTAAAHAPHMQQ